MKTQNLRTLHGLTLSLLACLALGLASAGLRAADDRVMANFDTDTSGEWSVWWGGATTAFSHRADLDAAGNPASGSLKLQVTWVANDNQFTALRSMGTMSGSEYVKLEFDLYCEGTSAKRPGGDYGWFETGFRKTDWGQIWLPAFAVTNADQWTHISLTIDRTAGGIDTINGIVFKMWGGSDMTGSSTFYVDNVVMKAAPPGPSPKPRLTVTPAKGGLNLFATAPGSAYQRQNIRTLNPVYSWVGAADPVTYSVTIDEFVAVPDNGYQAHIFLVPGSGFPTWESAPDWGRPHCIFFTIQQQANAAGWASLRHKTNNPNNNSMIWSTGDLGGVWSSSVRGTWTITFSQDTNITVTGPSGGVLTTNISPESAQLFTGPLYAYFGAQPNGVGNIGQGVIIGHIGVTGVPDPTPPINDFFADGALDTTAWEVCADSAVGVSVVPLGGVYQWMTWTLPDTGFVVESIESLDEPNFYTWTVVTGLTPIQIGATKKVLVSTRAQGSPTGNRFYRLYCPTCDPALWY